MIRAMVILTLEVTIQVVELFGGFAVEGAQENQAVLYRPKIDKVDEKIETIWTRCSGFKSMLQDKKQLPTDDAFDRWFHNGPFANMFYRGPVNRVRPPQILALPVSADNANPSSLRLVR